MKLKKAAMFGLDARIALAIFGALSVISGAALYSALSNLKVVNKVNKFVEIEKAIEQYYLDTGEILPLVSGSTKYRDFTKLSVSTNKLWKGPYINTGSAINYGAHCNACIWSTPEYDIGYGVTGIMFNFLTDGGSYTSNTTSCLSGDNCFLYILLLSQNDATANSIDEYIDGQLDKANGKIRVSRSLYNGNMINNIFYRTNMSINQFN